MMKFFNMTILMLFVCQLSFGQQAATDIYDVYMSFPKDQIEGLTCENDEPTTRRFLIDYKPNDNEIVLEAACGVPSVSMAFLGKEKNTVVMIKNHGMDNCEEDIQFYSSVDFSPISWPVPTCPKIEELYASNAQFKADFDAFTENNVADVQIRWKVDSELNLIAYIEKDPRMTPLVLGSWTSDDQDAYALVQTK